MSARHFGRAGQYLLTLTARNPEELGHDAQNLLRQGYEEYPSAPPSPEHRRRGGAWVLPPGVTAHQDREAARSELRDLERQFLHAAIAWLATRADAPPQIKNMKTQFDALKARLQ